MPVLLSMAVVAAAVAAIGASRRAAAATVDPMSDWRLTWSRRIWRSVAQVGSLSNPTRAARLWIVPSSDAWYAGARAATRSMRSLRSPASAHSRSPRPWR